jgi:hypothetical protein
MTPQQIEAMKLALEAQQIIAGLCADKVIDSKEENILRAAIKEALAEHAMREVQRLGQEIEQEQLISDQINYGMSVTQGGKRIDPMSIYKEPEQEPVAWIEKDMQCDDFDPDSVTCEKPTIVADGWEWVPLYTTPPQRKPLTDEEIFALENSIPDEVVSDRDWCIHFARAIEAAHGIKENQ